MTASINGDVAPYSQVKSYSEIAEVRPTEEQAVTLDISSGFTNRKYTDALLGHIDATEIKYMSRISGARFCLFLSDSATVRKLVEEVKVLNVEGHMVKIAPLVARSKKVIISNVSPVLSNTAIKRFLADTLKIRTASSVSELKANSGGDERLSSVHSFRRQIFIHPEDVQKLPSNHQFEANGKKYNVFFTTDKPVCFRCKSTEHFAKDCSVKGADAPDDMALDEQEEEESSPPTPSDEANKPALRPHDNALYVTDPIVPLQLCENAATNAMAEDDHTPPALDTGAITVSKSFDAANPSVFKSPAGPQESNLTSEKMKRTHSVISDSSTEIFAGEGSISADLRTRIPLPKSSKKSKNEDKTLAEAAELEKKKKEEIKRQTINELPVHLEPAKAYVEKNFVKSLIRFEELIRLLKKTAGKSPDIKRAVTAKYSTDTAAVIELLVGVHKLVAHSGTKNKITRLKHALQNPDSCEPDSDASLCSTN